MDKSKMLLIGCGKAGNALVNEMLNRDESYPNLFVNSEYEDMVNLSNFKKNNAFVFSNANGSGKDRKRALEYLKDQISVLAQKVLNYKLISGITIFTSADGGTGSGITPGLIKALRYTFAGMNEDKLVINLVAAMPSVDASDILGFKNAISFWNDIVEIKDMVSDIKYIDNTKGKSYDDVNKKATIDIDNSYDITGNDSCGDIDHSDTETIFSAKGYGITLTLPENCGNFEKALEKAKAESVFSLPKDWSCKYIAISLKKESLRLEGNTTFEKEYKVEDAVSYMDENDFIYESVFQTYNESHNTVVLTGVLGKPLAMIKMIKQGLEDAEERAAIYESKRVSKNEKIDISEIVENEVEAKEPTNLNSKERKEMLSKLKKLF